MKLKGNRAITLIALIITIIIMLIIAGVGIKTIFGENSFIEQSKKSGFLTNYYQVKELVQLYQYGKELETIDAQNENININANTNNLPVTTKLTEREVNEINDKNKTLAETIQILSDVSEIVEANIYWIDLELIGAKVPNRYIIDIDNNQIYDYEGEYFFKKRWHTPDLIEKNSALVESDIWDGWIILTLEYPENSTARMWRLSEEGEVRTDDRLEWQEYTGPIRVRISEVENIWIKYKIDDQTVIVPPQGKLLVDIQAEYEGIEKAKININFAPDAETKQYKINGGEWQDYEGEFIVTENVLIEAKGTKTEKIYDTEGNLETTQMITGTDAYFVRKLATEKVKESIPAPIIEKLDAIQEGEVARVKITYPETAVEKIYKLNYGEKQNYTEEISIKKYGTVVTAYYKTTEGTSVHAYLYIGANSSDPTTSSTYIPYPENTTNIPTPTYVLEGPIINISSTGEQATITLSTAQSARKKYIKLGNQPYEEYTGPITVNTNMIVKAYYISEKEGRTSKTSYAKVSGLSKDGKPSVVIDANPYPYGNSKIVDKVTVTITTTGSNLEYSFDNIIFTPYSGPLEITKNCRIYARATNNNGTTLEYLDITNLSNTPPAKKTTLSVNITVTPDSESVEGLVDKAIVQITYDDKATKKYYSIGKYGQRREYTGPFEVTTNCTIYAYAVSENGNGVESKVIDYLTTGIAEPIIKGDPNNNQSTTKTEISIRFDNTAVTKQYEINGDGLRDYTGEFEVTENCTIRAVNKNSLGQISEATYNVSNITAQSTPIILDKGDYYLIKLPYPQGSVRQMYKYKETGVWKDYKKDGIILIKPEKQDKVLSGDKVIIQIENENGNKINFNGDWYLLDIAISDVYANIFMTWDRGEIAKPTIVLNTTEPTNEVIVSILYDNLTVSKQYRIVYPDGTDTGWQEYTEPLTINQRGTKVYAVGQDELGTYSKEVYKTIQNIDNNPPQVSITLKNDTLFVKEKIKATYRISDNGGIKIEDCKWVVSNKSTKLGLDESLYTGGNFTKEYGTLETNEILQKGTYYLHILAKDIAGNAIEVISDKVKVIDGYSISTPEEFQAMGDNLKADYYLTQDIDMSNYNFTTISGKFTGSLDGRGYTIDGLHISSAKQYIGGIFEDIENATIKNILFKNVNCTNTDIGVAVIAAGAAGDNTFYKVGVTGKLSAKSHVASIVTGNLNYSTFENCYARTNIIVTDTTRKYDAGGLCYDGSSNKKISFSNCYWSGTISSNVKGRVGPLRGGGTIKNNDNQYIDNVSVKNSYYNKSLFKLSVPEESAGKGLETDDFKNSANFTGWDFTNDWYIGEDGYPELKF